MLNTSDIDWAEIIDKYNIRNCSRETMRKASQTIFGGFCVGNYYVDKMSNNNDDNYLKELRIQKQELKKEKQKLSDERVEFNRQIRQEARKESYNDMVKNIICKNVSPIQFDINPPHKHTDNDLLVHITDIHTGIEIDNFKNTFNQEILKTRLENYVSKILDVKRRHNSQDCYIVIGEIVSGLIHSNLRLQNNMDLMEQFKYICESLSSVLIEIAKNFNDVYVYTTRGNHSRISPKKEDSLDGENMDVLLPFYLLAKLQNISNIHIKENVVEPEIAMFTIRGKSIMAAHGHKDSPANVVQNFTMMFKIKPDIVLLGHRHLNGLTTVFDTKVIQSGCVSGTDEYAIGIRKTNKPEQTISVISENGLECLYDVQLD